MSYIYSNLFMTAEDYLRFLISAVIDDGVVKSLKGIPGVKSYVFDIEGLEQIYDKIRTVFCF